MLYELLAELLREVVSKPFLAMLAVLVASGFYVRSRLGYMAELHREVQDELGELKQQLEQLRNLNNATSEAVEPLAEQPLPAGEQLETFAADSADDLSLQQPPPLPDNLLDRIELPEPVGFEPEQAEPAPVMEQHTETEAEHVQPVVVPEQLAVTPEQAAAVSGSNPLWRLVAGSNPLVRLGVLILFLGLSFLLRYVSERTTVPISVRYAGVAATGVALLLAGWRWRLRKDSYGLILQGAGIAVLYLTSLAAMKLHPLLAPETGFAALAAVAALGVVLALRQDSLILALVATLGGFAAPVLAGSVQPNHLYLFIYLTIINLAVVGIAWFRAWRILNLSGFVCTLLLAMAWGYSHYSRDLFALTEPFLLLFFLLYVLAAFLFARRSLAEAVNGEQRKLAGGPISYVDATLVFGVPLSVFGLQYLLTLHWTYGPAWSALGFGLMYALLGWLLFRNTSKRYALLSETMVALALIFCSLAIPLALDGEWTAAAWAVEAAGVYWIGIRQQHRFHRVFALLLVLGSMAFFVQEVRIQSGDWPLLQGSWLGCLMLALVGALLTRLMHRAPVGLLSGFERLVQPAMPILSCVLAVLLGFMLLPAQVAAVVMGATALLALWIAIHRSWVPLGVVSLALQVLAGVVFFSLEQRGLWHVKEWGALVLSLWAFASAWLLSRLAGRALVMAGLLLAWAVLLWISGWIAFVAPRLESVPAVLMAWLALLLGSIWLWHAVERWLSWRQLGYATLLLLPGVLLIWLAQLLEQGPLGVLTGWGGLLWPQALVTHLYLLRQAPHRFAQGLVATLHVAGCWLFLLFASVQVRAWLGHWTGMGSVWTLLGWLPVVWLFVLSQWRPGRAAYGSHHGLYSSVVSLPVVLLLLLWTLLASWRGEAGSGSVYIPLLNPLELGQLITLMVVGFWWRSVLSVTQQRGLTPVVLLAAVPAAFVALSALVWRACHYWGGLEWSYEELSASMLAQSALSIVWAVLAIGLMLAGHRRQNRSSWIGGALLMALVVAKLFWIELAASGSLERIVSFLAVGGLLLLVGYFAPLPPRQAKAEG